MNQYLRLLKLNTCFIHLQMNLTNSLTAAELFSINTEIYHEKSDHNSIKSEPETGLVLQKSSNNTYKIECYNKNIYIYIYIKVKRAAQ